MKVTPFLASFVTIIVLGNVIILTWWFTRSAIDPKGLWSDAAAGWIQAIGTIDALLVAAIAPTWQRWSEQQDERKRRNITATAFSLTLTPQLAVIDECLENDISAVQDAIVNHTAGDVSVNYTIFGDLGPAIKFIQNSWDIIDGMNSEIVTALVRCVEAIRVGRDIPDHEESISITFGDSDPTPAQYLVFETVARAQQFVATMTTARDEVNRAIDEIAIATSGAPRPKISPQQKVIA